MVTFRANFYGPLNRGMVILDVFTQRNYVADFIRSKLNFVQNKNKKIAF